MVCFLDLSAAHVHFFSFHEIYEKTAPSKGSLKNGLMFFLFSPFKLLDVFFISVIRHFSELMH